jgi:type I restriction enzyme R subunit
MRRNEAQTRKKIIDKRLNLTGWDIKDPSQVTEELDIWIGLPNGVKEPQTPYQGHLFADYVLLGKNAKPIAVIEAKKTSVDAEIGKEQARNYAEKIKNTQNIPMPFVFYTNGHNIYYWDTERYPPRKVYGFPSRADLERIKFLRDNSTPLSSELIDSKISGRAYQIQAIRSILEKIENKKRKFLLVMATGTGKTRTAISLIDVLMRSNWIQRVLFLVDRVALREQALSAFREHLPNAPLWPKKGEIAFAPDRRVYVATYPSMLNIIKQDECPLTSHFFDLIIADESHRSIYNVYQDIFKYFDSYQLGLTATPTDHIDHNTFKLFNCEDGLPTFAYSYEEALDNVPSYLSGFEVMKLRTKFQQEGINSGTIAEADKKRLLAEGKDPDDIDFEGTELEKKVTNKGTNAVIVREFMEESLKDPNGVLPGKSIFFALSKKHAHRLCEVFDALYPEYKGQLAEVIISDVKGVHGKGGILDRFKNNDMPRVAISVDMLDTGIDILEITNLVFAKPVFSYTKFWQMVGRGTRVLDPEKIKPWCPEKDKFLIMDCWENFEYFKMKPKGRESKPTIPLPVRLFEARINKTLACIEANEEVILEKTKTKLKKDIQSLPKNSVVVLENKEYLESTEDETFWKNYDHSKAEYLKNYVSSIMRSKSEADFKEMRFELDIVDLASSKINKDTEKYETLKEGIIEKVSELPLSVNIVSKQKDLIEKVESQNFWLTFTDDDLDVVIDKLAPLMKFIEKSKAKVFKTDLSDLLTVKDYIEFGPKHERLTTHKYRQKVEDLVHELVKTNKSLQKLMSGEELTGREVDELSQILKDQYPNVTEYILREIYDNRSAKFIQFIKHILGLKPLATFTETVSFAFDEFIREHNNYSQQQIQFLLTLKSFILQRGKIQKKDLVNAPFTQLHPQGIRGIFKQNDINEILSLADKVAV